MSERIRRLSNRQVAAVGTAALLAVCGGCGLFGKGDASNKEPGIELIAVLPLRETPASARDNDDRPVLESHAGRAVTGQIYGQLATQTRYRFVPDLTVEGLVWRMDRRDGIDAARELARETGADAVLFGTVYRFQERIGPRYAAAQPASVSFDLALYSVAADEVVWKGQFDETQQPLSSNIFNAWMFWRAGPYWFSVRELSGLGVEKLFKTLPK